MIGASACARDDASRIPIEIRGGVPHVVNPDVGLWQRGGSGPRPRLVLEQAFGAAQDPAAAVLAGPLTIAMDDQGRVFALDRYDERLLAFTGDGKLAWAAGGEGQGPGEIETPRGIAWDTGERVVVANASGTRLDAWRRTDGEFLGTLAEARGETGSFAELIGAVSPEIIVVARFRRGWVGADAAQLRIAPAPETIATFELSPTELRLPEGMGMRPGIVVSGGLIGAGSLTRYEVRQFTPAGEPVRVITRPSIQLPGPGIDMELRAAGSNGGVEGPLRLGEYMLVSGHWPGNVDDPVADLRRRLQGQRRASELTYLLDLLDSEGRLLWSWRWEHPDRPEHGQILGTGPAGRLYTFAEQPFPQIRRYRLEVER